MLYVGWDGIVGWDGWMVIIGHRSSKSTFGDNYLREDFLEKIYPFFWVLHKSRGTQAPTKIDFRPY